MPLLKLSLAVLLAVSMVLVAGTSSDAQTRHHSNRGGMNQGGNMSSGWQSAQNQANQIAIRQHQVWLAQRRAKNAKEAAAKEAAKEARIDKNFATKDSADKSNSKEVAKTSTSASK